MTPDTIAALEALGKLATPAPWEVAGPFPNVSVGIPDPSNDDPEVGHWGFTPLLRLVQTAESYGDCTLVPDAAFIAALRNAAPELLATIREQGEEIERLKQGIARMEAAPTLGKMCAVLDELKGSPNDKSA